MYCKILSDVLFGNHCYHILSLLSYIIVIAVIFLTFITLKCHIQNVQEGDN
jgi:hypothetical protein